MVGGHGTGASSVAVIVWLPEDPGAGVVDMS